MSRSLGENLDRWRRTRKPPAASIPLRAAVETTGHKAGVRDMPEQVAGSAGQQPPLRRLRHSLLGGTQPSALGQALEGSTAGGQSRSPIALSPSLDPRLREAELRAVLPREIGHLAQGDLRWLAVARSLRRVTNAVTLVGWLSAGASLLVPGQSIDMAAVALLRVTPGLSSRLACALSRSRENEAGLASGAPPATSSARRVLHRQLPSSNDHSSCLRSSAR